MQKRKLGKSDLEVSAMGTWLHEVKSGSRSGGRHSGGDDRPHSGSGQHGVTFFDTAEVYGPFVNDELVGEDIETDADYK